MVDRTLKFKKDLTTNHSVVSVTLTAATGLVGYQDFVHRGKSLRQDLQHCPWVLGSLSISGQGYIHIYMKVMVGSVSMKLIILSVMNKGGFHGLNLWLCETCGCVSVVHSASSCPVSSSLYYIINTVIDHFKESSSLTLSM